MDDMDGMHHGEMMDEMDMDGMEGYGEESQQVRYKIWK